MISVVRKYYSWVRLAIGITIVMFGLNAVLELVEARAHVPEVPSFAPHSTARVVTETVALRDKDGSSLLIRNPFCSDCDPVEPEPDPENPDAIPLTKLPLDLIVTNLSSKQAWSFATLRNRDTSQQGSFWIGDAIPGGGPIERIGGTTVVFRNLRTKRLERVTLMTAAAPANKPVKAGTKKKVTPFDDQIHKLSDTSYEIDDALIRKLLNNPRAMKGMRFGPYMVDGKVRGFRLNYARQNSIATALGLKRGDVITSVNGMEATSADKLLEIYTKLRESTSLSISIERKGKPLTMSYRVGG